MATKFLTTEEAVKGRKWHLIDASEKTVGRLASDIASILRGKKNPKFTPHNDCGDFVVVVNAEKIRFTGAKMQNKLYHRHTGYVGNLKTESAEKLISRKPSMVLKLAVAGMLPKTAQGKRQINKLKIYKGDKHPHAAQLASSKKTAEK